MFAALSDQLYGHQNEHYAIRTKVVQYMRDHQEEFIQFIEVNKGGGTRRNARRSASRVTSPELSPEDFTLQYRNYLANMAQLGVKGDNQELRAFACIFDVNVTVHMPQKDNDFIVYGGSEELPHVHVAYHKVGHFLHSSRYKKSDSFLDGRALFICQKDQRHACSTPRRKGGRFQTASRRDHH